MRHGKGIYTFQNGDCYEGSWKDNRQHGEGTYIKSNGERNEG